MTEPLTPEEIRAKYPPSILGPTWQKNDDGSWSLPKHSLGWEVLGWLAEYLNSPTGEGPFIATNEQARFLLWWYAVDERGEFVYRTGVMQRLKGHGKDPLAAAMCLVELCGPSRFSHWSKDGEPVAMRCRNALVMAAAVNQEQTTNTSDMFPVLMTERFKNEFRVEAGVELIRAFGGTSKLKAVTSSPRALEGARSTFVLLNESQWWTSGNKGIQMYETIDGNATKIKGRYLAICNAYIPGEDSVGERMRGAYEAIVEGRAADVGFLYDSLEAHPETPLDPEILPTIIEMIRGDSVWLDPESIVKSVQSLTMSPARSRRVWLNCIVSEEDSVYRLGDWRRLANGFEDATLKPGDEITLGFDGGKTDDATVLLGYRLSDGFVQILGIWERPAGWDKLGGADAPKWHVPQDEVDSRVHEAFRLYKVRGFYADVSLWESYIHEWTKAYAEGLTVKASASSPIGWDMRNKKASTYSHESLIQAVLDQRIHHNNDLTLQRHVMNARRRTNSWGVGFGKESPDSPKKVDAYAALMLAHQAAFDIAARGKEAPRERTNRMWLF